MSLGDARHGLLIGVPGHRQVCCQVEHVILHTAQESCGLDRKAALSDRDADGRIRFGAFSEGDETLIVLGYFTMFTEMGSSLIMLRSQPTFDFALRPVIVIHSRNYTVGINTGASPSAAPIVGVDPHWHSTRENRNEPRNLREQSQRMGQR